MVAGVLDGARRRRARDAGSRSASTDDVGGTEPRHRPRRSTSSRRDGAARVFFGLGADGTVGANKNTIKILGEAPACYAQGYFVYDSKKSGSQTVSHLRFGAAADPSAPTSCTRASFVGCHQFGLSRQLDVLGRAADGATLLLNCPHPPDEVWDALPRTVQEQILAKRHPLFAIDATRVAREAGLPGRTNTVLQTCFFALSGVLPRDEAIARIKEAIEHTYGRRGAEVVDAELRGRRPRARGAPRGRGAGPAHVRARHARRRCPTRRPSSSAR